MIDIIMHVILKADLIFRFYHSFFLSFFLIFENVNDLPQQFVYYSN